MNLSYHGKNEVRFHRTLSNGQHVAVYFQGRVATDGTKEVGVAVCVGRTRRECNEWYTGTSHKLNNKSTGKAGVEALSYALKCIKHVSDNMMHKGDVMIIKGTDMKRTRAYRYLERLDFMYLEEDNIIAKLF